MTPTDVDKLSAVLVGAPDDEIVARLVEYQHIDDA